MLKVFTQVKSGIFQSTLKRSANKNSSKKFCLIEERPGNKILKISEKPKEISEKTLYTKPIKIILKNF